MADDKEISLSDSISNLVLADVPNVEGSDDFSDNNVVQPSTSFNEPINFNLVSDHESYAENIETVDQLKVETSTSENEVAPEILLESIKGWDEWPDKKVSYRNTNEYFLKKFFVAS